MKNLREEIIPINDLKPIFMQIKKGNERIIGWIHLPSREYLSALTDLVTVTTYSLISAEMINVTGKLVWIIPEEQERYWISWFETMFGH